VLFTSFCPAISNDAAKKIRRTIRSWRLHLCSGLTLADLARQINPVVRGWINYYGRFYPSELLWALHSINEYLMRWAMRKYKRLRRRPKAAWELVAGAKPRPPGLFAHWPALTQQHHGRWQPDDGRLSRTDLRASGGATAHAD